MVCRNIGTQPPLAHVDTSHITKFTSSRPCNTSLPTVWPTSQSSDDQCSTQIYRHPLAAQTALRPEVPAEQRTNPRRSSSSATSRNGCPPPLVRQCDRKVNFVDNLVDSSTQIVETIWPLSSVVYRQELGNKAVLPLRTFIQETLRRSRTSYSTLQVALYYLILIKPHVPKHNFTMEQPDDVHANRALQCGRRMFLAALVLASKYLQDRNYSARAWSKISGLATQEINQNEMAFLVAVNWKLHITDKVFKRWTDIVLKHTPQQPPSPGPLSPLVPDQQNQDWKNFILSLEPELENIAGLVPTSPLSARPQELTPVSPITPISSMRERGCAFGFDSSESAVTPKGMPAPPPLEPTPPNVYTPGRLAPALGLLPTPRLTPQSAGLNTPAVGAASCLLANGRSMGLAMNQAANMNATQALDRWPGAISTSPTSYVSARRSSLATSVSTASSPESMVSDTSRSSRSSSISSASSLASAPSSKLDVQARCRYAKLNSERCSVRPSIASVPEDFEADCSSSPDSYTGPVGKELLAMSLDTPIGARGVEVDDAADAARALQDLHNYPSSGLHQMSQRSSGVGSKRPRTSSVDNSLQANVREMLSGENYFGCNFSLKTENYDFAARSSKRFCYAPDVQIPAFSIPSLHPAVGGPGGPGMWSGILN